MNTLVSVSGQEYLRVRQEAAALRAVGGRLLSALGREKVNALGGEGAADLFEASVATAVSDERPKRRRISLGWDSNN